MQLNLQSKAHASNHCCWYVDFNDYSTASAIKKAQFETKTYTTYTTSYFYPIFTRTQSGKITHAFNLTCTATKNYYMTKYISKQRMQ